MNMINTNQCEKCTHGSLDESNKAKIVVYCEVKEKKYIYGQCVLCEEFEKRKE